MILFSQKELLKVEEALEEGAETEGALEDGENLKPEEPVCPSHVAAVIVSSVVCVSKHKAHLLYRILYLVIL